MTYIITAILIVSLLFIATERQTGVSKAAVAMFACTLGWVLYIGWGTDFVMSQHHGGYMAFLNGIQPNSIVVKEYIARDIFVPYVGHAAEIVLFLLATMTIVDVLATNGCFDFLTLWIRTRNSRLLMWKLTAFAFFMSINLDNISAIVLMLTVTNQILPKSSDRKIYGSLVFLAVIFGGALSVIGDPTGLVLWTKGAITATDYSLSMLLPCLVAWVVPTYIIGRRLPETVVIEQMPMPYRGNDTNLNVWQRIIVFCVGIGGLWFIPTFHDITKLPPFIGALCVLSVLWIVNEIFNRKLNSVSLRHRSAHMQQMQQNSIQQILYIIGVILALGVVTETGAMKWFAEQLVSVTSNVWIVGAVVAVISMVLDSFASCITMVSFHDVSAVDPYYATGGAYWKVLSFCTAMGGSIFAIGSFSGIVMMRMQDVTLKWYSRHVMPVVLMSGLLAFVIICLQLTL